MAKQISLAYGGYWREANFHGVPTYSGVYSFMECRFNPSDGTVSLAKILYIGQADNIRDRVSSHDKLTAMRNQLAYGNELCIHCAPVVDPDKSRAEAALVYQHQPLFNEQLKSRFDYDTTTISNTGQFTLLQQYFTVYKTSRSYRYY